MKSVVIHYKELALKGKNRPWFIQLLVRNLKTALAGLHVASVRSSVTSSVTWLVARFQRSRTSTPSLCRSASSIVVVSMQ